MISDIQGNPIDPNRTYYLTYETLPSSEWWAKNLYYNEQLGLESRNWGSVRGDKADGPGSWTIHVIAIPFQTCFIGDGDHTWLVEAAQSRDGRIFTVDPFIEYSEGRSNHHGNKGAYTFFAYDVDDPYITVTPAFDDELSSSKTLCLTPDLEHATLVENYERIVWDFLENKKEDDKPRPRRDKESVLRSVEDARGQVESVTKREAFPDTQCQTEEERMAYITGMYMGAELMLIAVASTGAPDFIVDSLQKSVYPAVDALQSLMKDGANPPSHALVTTASADELRDTDIPVIPVQRETEDDVPDVPKRKD